MGASHSDEDSSSLPSTNLSDLNKTFNDINLNPKSLVEGGKVDMRLVSISLWKNRSNPDFVAKMCYELSLLLHASPVLDQVEFYLPQLAHMILHLKTELPITALQQFVILVSQSSIHFALQFFWMVYATLDENRPKLGGDRIIFMRCAQLLLSLEQCIVYGSPVNSEAKNLYAHKCISKLEMEEILMADRRFFAAQNTLNNFNEGSNVQEGYLYKKGGGTSRMGRRNWNIRWCTIERRVLFVYNKATDIHARSSVPLAGAEIRIKENPKHPFYFEVYNKYSDSIYKFAALKEEEFTMWIQRIKTESQAPNPPAVSPSRVGPARTLANMSQDMRSFILRDDGGNVSPRKESCNFEVEEDLDEEEEREASIVFDKDEIVNCLEDINENERIPNIPSSQVLPPSPPLTLNETKKTLSKRPSMIRHNLNSAEQRRYDYFNQQRLFIKEITDICEGLRSVEVPQREQELQQKLENLTIPENSFIPLCKSTDLFCSVLYPCSKEGHVFSTHERVPCLILFEVIEDPNLRNVAVALDMEYYDGNSSSSSSPSSSSTSPSPSSFSPSTQEMNSNFPFTPRDIVAKLSTCISVRAPDVSSLQTALFKNEEKCARVTEIFGELWIEKKNRIREKSKYKDNPNWSLISMIAKSNDDLRQEVFVMQLISFFQDIFSLSNLPLILQPYRILSTGASTGLIEVVKNAKSLDAIKKKNGYKNLKAHFEYIYGNSDTNEFIEAQNNFVYSLAAYSIVCYILAIKDRHNGNILLDVDGRIIHIDFGFLLGRAPGGSFSMEIAPFKFTTEMVDLMGGKESLHYKKFTQACIDGMIAIREQGEALLTLVEIMAYESTYPCFQGNSIAIINALRERLFLHLTKDKIPAAVEGLIERSYNHFGTTKYDQFQTYSNGIAR